MGRILFAHGVKISAPFTDTLNYLVGSNGMGRFTLPAIIVIGGGCAIAGLLGPSPSPLFYIGAFIFISAVIAGLCAVDRLGQRNHNQQCIKLIND